MEKFVYPLLHYQLTNGKVLGLLVGTAYQIVDKDLKNVKATLTTYLKRLYKKYDNYPYAPFDTFRLKTFEVKVRPIYRDENRSYPASKTIKVPVDAVFGPTDRGNYCCFLPLLNERFYYYDPKLLHSLVQNFATNILNQRSPSELYRMITGLRPNLDEIVLRINLQRSYQFSNGWNFENKFEELESMATPYPKPKGMRKQAASLPDVAWERGREINETIDKLLNMRSNVLLVGEHGTGKSAVLRQAIRTMTAKAAKTDLTFWQLIAQRITARAKYLGEWQENVEELLYELDCANGILWVMDVVQLLQIGGEGPEDSVAAFLTSFLQNGKLQLVGEVTPAQLESMRRMLPGFVENFQLVQLDALSEAQVQSILNKFADYCRQNLKIDIPTAALNLTYRLLLRYYPYEQFPGKGVKFLSQCISQAQKEKRSLIGKEQVVDKFIQQTGMPALFLKDDLLLDHNKLQSYFEQQIIGQPQAIQAMMDVVKIFKAGLNSPNKPIATMIFAGPTGVGKTASTKALANYFFGEGQRQSPLVRIDMSEFQHPAQLTRFIGIGGEVGKLVQDIRERPFSVLLLDEIEKADPSIFDALLTVLDEGLLVDAYGRVTNFRNTIIIMTSNLGASNRTMLGFGQQNTTNYESAIGRFFRPEFVNRIDHIVTFNALEQSHIQTITKLELAALSKREGIEKRGLQLRFSPALEDYLATVGFDERYGARPLQRALEQAVIAPLAKWLLVHAALENAVIHLDWDGLNLRIKQLK